MSNIIALLPARFAATRLPGKLMKELGGKTVIRRTYEAVQQTGLFDEVIVVCDHEILYREVVQYGGKAMMSSPDHESGSDRIAEAARQIEADIVVNVQGDEPFIEKAALEKVIALFNNPDVRVGSLMIPISDPERILNPNCVKVVCDREQRALYFSRAAIPYHRAAAMPSNAFQHIGVYAFRKEALLHFTSLPVSPLEQIEKLENLRMLENGIPIHLACVDHVGISIDTAEDFQRALDFVQQQEGK